MPEVGTSWALTRALGYRRAFEYYVTGEHLTAERALELGLVNDVADACDECMRPALHVPRAGVHAEHADEIVRGQRRGVVVVEVRRVRPLSSIAARYFSVLRSNSGIQASRTRAGRSEGSTGVRSAAWCGSSLRSIGCAPRARAMVAPLPVTPDEKVSWSASMA